MTTPTPNPGDMRDPANHPLPSRPDTRGPQLSVPRPRFAQRSLVIGLLLAFILIFWTVQLFILMTALDAYLGKEHGLLWPSALSSLLLAALSIGLVRLIPKDPDSQTRSELK